MQHVNHISLCAGVGGIDLGLKHVIPSIRTVAMVEREAFCLANLAYQIKEGRLDNALLYTDLTRFPWERYRNILDLVSGGFPCQPFSHAGKQQGVEDERHLWPYIRQGLDTLGCRYCFFENVDGIASAPSPGYHSVLHHVLVDLEELGFTPTAGCFTAAEVGAPHLRKRWFILGVRDPKGGGLPRVIKHEHAGWVPDIVLREPQQLADPRRDAETSRGEREAPEKRSDVGDAEVGGRRDVGEGHIQSPRETPRLAHSIFKGLERYPGDVDQSGGQNGGGKESGSAPKSRIQPWPARPGEDQRDWDPSRVTFSDMGRNTHGLSDRVDRLKALGNAVVPAVAAKAFSTLWYRIQHG